MGADHPSAIRADFRSRFGISFEDAGESYSWHEAIYLVQALLADTTSLLQASVRGWKYPVSREWMMLAELYDLDLRIHSRGGKAKPVPRPWPDPNKSRVGSATSSRKSILENLERMNPKEQ